MNQTKIKTTDLTSSHEEHLDNIRKVRSVREVGYHHSRVVKQLLTVMDKLANPSTTKVDFLQQSFQQLLNVDEELRVMLVILVSFPPSDRKTKLSTDIEKTRLQCSNTQTILTKAISSLTYKDLKVSNSNLLSVYEQFFKAVQSIFDDKIQAQPYTSPPKLGIFQQKTHCYIKCSTISINRYQPDDFYLVLAELPQGGFRLGVSSFKYSLGYESCSIYYDLPNTNSVQQVQQTVFTLSLSLGYLPKPLYQNYLSMTDFQATQSYLLGWLNKQLFLRLSFVAEDNPQARLTLKRWLSFTISVLSGDPAYNNPDLYDTYKQAVSIKRDNSNKLGWIIEFDPFKFINSDLNDHQYRYAQDLLKQRLLFLANTLLPSTPNFDNFIRKTHRLLALERSSSPNHEKPLQQNARD